ncbi:Calx-beta domain-containing protein [Actinoplanes sp. NPDC026670]|uniref:Calx-beta domain-containing protein n=1 Tax=Actinoplanes sp. NPDC026670 TaxID=3154700 RepID=UPI0033D06B78
MRISPAHAAQDRTPRRRRMRKPLRTAMSVVVAATLGLMSAVVAAAPAPAALNDVLTIPDAGGYEGHYVTFTLTYSGSTAATVDVTAFGAPDEGTAVAGASTAAGFPVAGADFVNGTGLISSSFNPSTRTIVFPASSAGSPSTATVNVVTGDDADTADESFTLHAALAGGSEVTATGTIWALPSVIPSFTYSAPATVPEGQPSVTVTATLSQAQPHDITIPITTGPGAAPVATSTGGVHRDYTELPAGTKIKIPAGRASGSIDISLWDDSVYEGPTQNLKVITGTLVGVTGPGAVEIGLTDNESMPTVSIGDAPAVLEGAKSVFPITLSSLSDAAVTVTVTTVSGADTSGSYGATKGLDFTAPAASVKFPALSRTAELTVSTTADNDVEGTETYTATLSNPVNAALSTQQTATGTILDDTTKPIVTYLAPNAAMNGAAYVPGDLVNTFVEGDAEERSTFINLSVAATTSQVPVQLAYSFVKGTATPGVDYRGAAGAFTVPVGAGETTLQIPVTIIGDRIVDRDETFSVALSSPNGTVNPKSLSTPMTFVISDTGDVLPTWSTGDVSVAEGNSGPTTARVPITLSGPASADVAFTAEVADIADVAGTDSTTETGVSAGATVGDNDYDLPAKAAVLIAAGSTTGYLDIPVNGDVIYERDEAFTVRFIPPPSGLVAATGTTGVMPLAWVTVKNDDAAPTVSFNQTSSTEGSTIRIKGTTAGLSQAPYRLSFSVAPVGTNPATPTIDYQVNRFAPVTATVARGAQGPLVLDGVATETTIADVHLSPDDIDEATETFGVIATETSPAPLVGIATTTGVYRIVDDPADLPPTASIGNATVPEGAGSVDVPVSLVFTGETVSSSQPYTLSYHTLNGLAVEPGDYTAVSGTLTIPAGVMTSTIKVPIIDDEFFEPDEKFLVKIGMPGPAGATLGDHTGEVTIQSDDDAHAKPTIAVPSTVRGATAVVVSGSAGDSAGIELWSAPLAGGDLERVATGAADAAGIYSFKRWIGVGTRFQVKSAGMESEVKTVRITQVPVFTAASSRAGKLTLTVRGNPAGSKQAVTVQRLVKGAWANTSWKGVTGKNNKWAATVKAKSKSTWTLRARIAGSAEAGVNAGTSKTRKVTIK